MVAVYASRDSTMMEAIYVKIAHNLSKDVIHVPMLLSVKLVSLSVLR